MRNHSVYTKLLNDSHTYIVTNVDSNYEIFKLLRRTLKKCILMIFILHQMYSIYNNFQDVEMIKESMHKGHILHKGIILRPVGC